MPDIVLYAGEASPKDIRLYSLPATGITLTPIFLYEGRATPQDITLDDPRYVRETGGGGFPTQYSGLKVRKSGSTIELCLVAEGDAATGMGGVPKIRKGGTTYAIYLVETTDPDASPVRIKTTTGIKSVRLKT